MPRYEQGCGILRVEIYKFLLASGHVRGNITESSVAARSGATFRAKIFEIKALI
jgi:hypothetical protein